VDMRARRCGVVRSTDGGQTWDRPDASPSPASFPFCFHTSGGVTQTPLAFGRDGTLYYGLVGWDTQDGGARGNHSVLLARSTNLGESWATTIVRDARGKTDAEVENNRPVASVAVDTKSGDKDIVYVAWRGNWPSAKPDRASRPMVAVSTDGGRSFSEPLDAAADFYESPAVRGEAMKRVPPTPQPGPEAATTASPAAESAEVPPPTTFGGGNPQVAVDDKGALYVLWVQATPFSLTPRPEHPMYISRSTDRGRSFTVTEVSPASNWYGGPILRWSNKGGPDGSLHVVYEDKLGQTQGDRDIFYRRSVDGGKTWTDPRILHDDDPKLLIGQFIPNFAVAPNGRLDVAWWDFRDDPGTYLNDVYYTYSTDNGETWSDNIRVTDRSINRRIGPWSNNFDMRQPPGIAPTDAFALLAWDDTRDGEPVGQAQDIYAAAVQFREVGGGVSRTIQYLLAGVAGLLVVGLVLLGVALAGRRRSGPPPPATEFPRDRQPVGVG
ncbi:MAG TPA: sialidase family protein, partial [Acidimicrobiales bacterium]|nr:sialidase family protein [Acidimicrobiales bacterium]